MAKRDLDELELAVLRAITVWRLGLGNAGNLHALGMAAVEKIRTEQRGNTDDWYRMKRKVPHTMETLVLGGYLDEQSGETTPKGRAILDR